MASPTPPANPNSPSSSTKSNVAPPAPTKLPPPPPPPPPPPLPPHNPDTPLAPPSATATKSPPPPPPLLPPPSTTATKSPPPPPPPPPLPNQPLSSTPTITSASSSSSPVNLTGSDPTPHMKAGEVGDVPLPRTTDPKGTTGPIPDPIPDASADLQNVNRGSEIGHQQEQRTDDWTVEIEEEGEKEIVEIEEVEEEETVQQSTADASTRVPTREAVSNPQLRQRHRNPRDGRDLEGQEDTDLEKPLINGSPRVKSFCDYLVQFCGWRKTSDGTSGDDDPPPPPPPPPGDSSSSNDLDPTEDVEDKTYGFMGMLLFFSITMIPILEHQSSKKPLSPQPSQKSWDWEQGLYDLFYTASQCICVISLIFVFAIAIKLFKEGGQAKRSMNRRLMHTLRFLFVLLCVAALLRCSSPFFHLYFIVALIGISIIQLIKVFRSGWDWNQLFLL